MTDLLGDLLGRGRVGGIVDGDVGTLFGKEEGGGCADSFAAARDEGGLAGEGARHGCGICNCGEEFWIDTEVLEVLCRTNEK